MADNATIRLNKVLRELNISLDRAVDFLNSKGHDVEARPTTKISNDVYQVLLDEFQTDMSKKVASKEVGEEKRKEKEAIRIQLEQEQEERRLARERRKAASENVIKAKAELSGPKTVGKIDLETNKKVAPTAPAETPKEEKAAAPKKAAAPEPKQTQEQPASPKDAPVAEAPKAEGDKPQAPEAKEAPAKEQPEADISKAEEEDDRKTLQTQYQKLSGPKITGAKIDLSKFQRPKKKKEDDKSGSGSDRKKRRKRIVSKTSGPGTRSRKDDRKGNKRFGAPKVEPSEEDVQKQVRETLEKLQGKSKKGKGAKYRRDKRDQHRQQTEKDLEQQEKENKTLKVTEFVTASEVATMMEVSTTDIISACMSLGIMVTMNQRLDAETLSIVADEFGYEVEFVTADIEESIVSKRIIQRI